MASFKDKAQQLLKVIGIKSQTLTLLRGHVHYVQAQLYLKPQHLLAKNWRDPLKFPFVLRRARFPLQKTDKSVRKGFVNIGGFPAWLEGLSSEEEEMWLLCALERLGAPQLFHGLQSSASSKQGNCSNSGGEQGWGHIAFWESQHIAEDRLWNLCYPEETPWAFLSLTSEISSLACWSLSGLLAQSSLASASRFFWSMIWASCQRCQVFIRWSKAPCWQGDKHIRKPFLHLPALFTACGESWGQDWAVLIPQDTVGVSMRQP